LKILKKYIFIVILDFLLFIPIFFDIFVERLFINDFSLERGLVLLIGIITLIIIGLLTVIFGYEVISMELMKNHDVVSALIHKNNKPVKILFFPLTMVMEEFIFRYYLIGIFIDILNRDHFWGILMSSITFSFYHFHIWFGFRNVRITCIYMVYSFLLGLYLGFVLLTIGFIFCVLIHYLLVFFLYLNLSKNITKT
jgi:hypothetical protein